MGRLKGPILGIAVVVGIVVGAWLVLFGTAAPCDAFSARLAAALKDEPADVRKSAADMAKDMSPVLCAAGAFRLAAGDKSFIKVVKH